MKKYLLSVFLLCLVLAGTSLAESADVSAVLAKDGQTPEGFVALLTKDGTVYSEMAVESFSSLVRDLEIPDGTEFIRVSVIADHTVDYPYLHPENPWSVVVFEDALPDWYSADSEAALLAAFEAWKAEAYAIFDPSVILSLVNPQTISVTEVDVTEEIKETLSKWADIDSNWMVCYVRNSVPTTTQAAVGKSIANDAWNYVVNMVWTQTGEDLAGHSQVDLIASFVGSAFPGISQWEGYFGAEEGYPFATGAKLLTSGFLYFNGLYSAKEIKEFDDRYDPNGYQNLTLLAAVSAGDTGSAFACLVDESGNVYWSLETDYVSGLREEFGLDVSKAVALNVGPKEDKNTISAGTTYTAAGWSELENGYFTTGAWEDADAEKPDFFAEDGSATWRMNADGSVEPAGADMSTPGGTINPGKYSYIDDAGDVQWEIMLAGNGTCRLTVSTAQERADAAAALAAQADAPKTTYFNVMPPMTDVKNIGPVPAWYDERKDEINEAAKVAFADWQKAICELVDVDALNNTMKGLSLDQPTELTDEVMANFVEWVQIWNEKAVAGSINIGISTLGYKAVGPTIWNQMDDTVLANYKSMDHEGCPGPTTSPAIAAYALETYGKVIDAATDDYMGSTMNDVYSAHVGSFIRHLQEDEDGNYIYAVAHRLWEDGTIPFFDGEYWYLVSGPDFDPDGNPAVQVIYSATPAQILGE